MRIGTHGIVVDEFGRVLLIRRNDTRTWAPPGGSLEAAELPPEGVAREVEEETGLKVMPVRLVGLTYWSSGRDGLLIFSFRCLVRGGALQPSPESPQVDYLPANPLPRPMLGSHREPLARDLRHQGGPPMWQRQGRIFGIGLARRILMPLVKGILDLQRRRQGLPAYEPPPTWQAGAFVIIRDEAGQVLWVRRRDYDVWNLPGGQVEPGEAPWETAVRETQEETGLTIRLTDLAGVYVKPGNEMVFSFLAEPNGGQLTPGPEAAEFAYFPPGQEPANSLPKQVERVADTAAPRDKTLFKRQSGQPGLEQLGLV